MTINGRCPRCQSEMQIANEIDGKVRKCLSCSHSIPLDPYPGNEMRVGEKDFDQIVTAMRAVAHSLRSRSATMSKSIAGMSAKIKRLEKAIAVLTDDINSSPRQRRSRESEAAETPSGRKAPTCRKCGNHTRSHAHRDACLEIPAAESGEKPVSAIAPDV